MIEVSILITWIALMVKLGYDQSKLQLAQAGNKPEPSSDAELGIPNPLSATKEGLKSTFANDSENPEVQKLARRVRIDYFVMVGMSMLIIVLIIISLLIAGPA